MYAFATAALATVSTADLAVTWNDCGDDSYHVKLNDLQPSSLTLGQKTTIKGFGSLDKDVAEGVNFDLAMEGSFLDCKGDISQGAKCNFPLDMGSIGFQPIQTPISAGEIPITVNLRISRLLPATLLETTTQVTARGKSSGKQMFCLNVYTKKSADSHLGVGILDVDWSDCGDADTKALVHNLTPSQLRQGKDEVIVGTGTLSEDIGEEVEFESSMRLKFLNCAGDATKGKKCNFPLKLGSIEMKAVNVPLSAGDQEIDVDLQLAKILPDGTVSTTHVTAVTESGDKLFCLDVNTGPMASAVTV